MTRFSATILDPKAGRGRLRIAGSPLTVILFVLIFVTNSYYNVRVAMDTSAMQNVALVSAVLALSGLSTGIMFGRVSKLFAGHFGRSTFAAAE